jgi:hypothetical protein
MDHPREIVELAARRQLRRCQTYYKAAAKILANLSKYFVGQLGGFDQHAPVPGPIENFTRDRRRIGHQRQHDVGGQFLDVSEMREEIRLDEQAHSCAPFLEDSCRHQMSDLVKE